MDPSTNYIAADMRKRLKGQAIKAWFVGLAVVLLWAAVIVAAPLLKGDGVEYVSSPLYHFFSYVCHQIPERSLHLGGHPLAVCSRCFGVYFGLLAGFVGYPLLRPVDEIEPLPRIWLFLSIIPISVDWSLTIFGIWENTHLSRFVTGTLLGFACAVFIIPAIVEIARNFTLRNASRT